MFRIGFTEGNCVSQFLHINDVDFVDVMLKDSSCYFITDSNESFAVLSVDAECSAGQGDVQFRIHRKLLASIGKVAKIEFTVTESEVTAVFINEHDIVDYSCRFSVQVIAAVRYAEKLTLVSGIPCDIQLPCDELAGLYRIAKYNGGIVNVEGGVAAVLLKNGARVYKRVSIAQSFAFSSRAFECLRKCSKSFASMEDYLIAQNGELCVVVRKARLSSNEEFKLIESKKFGSKFIAELQLGNLFKFLYKFKSDLESVTICVDRECCEIGLYNSIFTIPILFNATKLAEGAVTEDISIPTKILTSVLNNLGSNEFTMKVKQHYIQFETGDYVVVI